MISYMLIDVSIAETMNQARGKQKSQQLIVVEAGEWSTSECSEGDAGHESCCKNKHMVNMSIFTE